MSCSLPAVFAALALALTACAAPIADPALPAAAAADAPRAVAGAPSTPEDRAARLALPEMAPLSFFLGEWDVQVYDANTGAPLYRARTHARPALDGHVIQDDWRALDAAGNVFFRGMSLRSYVPATGRWTIHWSMANTRGHTYLDAEWRDGEIHGTGFGFDGAGQFTERLRYFDITGDSYSFRMERSYDGGATWTKISYLKATRRA